MTNTKNAKKVNQLFQDLYSSNSAKVTTALDALQVYGNHTVIKPLFEFIQKTTNDQSKKEAIEFLSNLKDTPSKAEIMKNVHNQDFKPIQNIILSTIWNSPLDYSEFLNEFVLLAVENNYLTSLECLTIIENLEGPFSEQSILESQLHLKDYLEGKYLKSTEKDNMISEIALLIKDFDRTNQEYD